MVGLILLVRVSLSSHIRLLTQTSLDVAARDRTTDRYATGTRRPTGESVRWPTTSLLQPLPRECTALTAAEPSRRPSSAPPEYVERATTTQPLPTACPAPFPFGTASQVRLGRQRSSVARGVPSAERGADASPASARLGQSTECQRHETTHVGRHPTPRMAGTADHAVWLRWIRALAAIAAPGADERRQPTARAGRAGAV